MKNLYVSLLLLFPSFAFSQDLIDQEPIATDRPDQTETPAIVPKGMFQMENGFVYEKASKNSETIVTPTILWKYGINENFELRLITEFTSVKENGEKFSGLSPILVGFKVGLTQEKGMIPKTSFIAHLLIPDLASKNFKANHYATEFRFTMQHTLSDKVNLGYNLGAEWDGISPDATFIYTLTTGFSISEKFGAYTEIYGFAPEEEMAYHSFDGGITYMLSDNMMVDVSGGFGITEEAPDYFASLGFSFRI